MKNIRYWLTKKAILNCLYISLSNFLCSKSSNLHWYTIRIAVSDCIISSQNFNIYKIQIIQSLIYQVIRSMRCMKKETQEFKKINDDAYQLLKPINFLKIKVNVVPYAKTMQGKFLLGLYITQISMFNHLIT